MADGKKTFSWADDDKAQATAPATGGNKPFSWDAETATAPNGLSRENLAANKALNAQPTQFEKDRAGSTYTNRLLHPAARWGTNAAMEQELGQGYANAAKTGADAMIGTNIVGPPLARLAESHVLPALKALPFAGKVVSAIDEAPGLIGKAVRGATVGGAAGGTEGLIRGHGLAGSARDAAEGAAFGGAAGLALPAIHKLAGPTPSVNPGAPLPSGEEFYENRGAEMNKIRSMNEALDRRQAAAARANAPEPELGSPENPGFHSKLPTRMPQVAAPTPELGSPENPGFHSKLPTRMPAQIAAPEPEAPLGSAENPGWHSKVPSRMPKVSAPSAEAQSPIPGVVAAPQADVIRVPEPRNLLPNEKVGYNASTPRRLLLDNALQGRPGAAEMLRNAGKTPLFVTEGGYAPPKERITFGESAPERSRITLNPIGETGARPIVSPANQFESSFGPEHQEVGDLAEWETGSREGVRPKRVLVP